MNWQDAQAYIELLAYGGAVTFQTFDDTEAKRPGFARILHGRLRDHVHELEQLNKSRAGIFVAVNETDLRGRRAENIISLRALFADDDGGGVRTYPLAPTFIVHSVRGPQPYWLLRRGEAMHRFGGAQGHLAAALRTDPKVIDLPRVMRLPGTWHCKGKPQMVTLEPGHIAKRYTIDEVLAAYPAPIKPAAPRPCSPPRHPEHVGGRNEWWRFLRRTIQKGRRNDELFRIACRMRHEGIDAGRIATALADLNARLCAEPLAAREVQAIALSVARY